MTDLRALRDKYERMLLLRRLHARAKAEADFEEPDPRVAMAELARLFPGALREIDELPLDVIEASIAALEAAERDPGRITPWMPVQARFHALARGILGLKRWMAGRPLTPMLAETCAQDVAALPEPARGEASVWLDRLADVAGPPRGRLMELVYARLATELDLDLTEIRAAVVRVPRSGRRGS